MVDLGYQDTDWVDGNDRGVSDAILPPDSFALATLSVDKRKYGYLGSISSWFGTLRRPPRVTDG